MTAFWRDQSVLVTGCTGLLGAWLTHELLERGSRVIGLVRDSVPRTNFTRLGLDGRVVVVRGEVENYLLLERVLNEYEVEGVFHLAAQTIVPIANRDPLSTFETNIRGTWNLLEACRRNGRVRRVVVASSDKAYGEQPTLPYLETAALQGTYPYDVSKSCADLIARAYFHTYRLPVCITRCGNLFGGGDLNFNRLVPGTIRSALYGEPPLIRSDGTLRRDYFYVRDAVEAYMTLAERIDDGGCAGEAFNFSLEQPLTVLEMTGRILTAMDRQGLTPIIQGLASGEIREQYLSADKARRLLGWEPRYSLGEALRETVEWYRWYCRD